MNRNEREHALKILTNLLVKKTSLSHMMSASANASPMTKEICFGFCRHYFRLQAIADCLLKKKPKEIEIWIIVLMGIYQLHYMQLPEYAVVKETVALLEKIKKNWAKGLVNAVLRNLCRKHHEILTQLGTDSLFMYGQPLWLLKRLQEDWPHEWQSIAQANDTHPPMTLRVNIKTHSRIQYLDCLQQAGIAAQAHPIAPSGVTLVSPCDVSKLPYFTKGSVSVQDGAAQLAVSLLALKPGLRVLDACCAPGGKTGHILETEPNLATCIALDIDGKRLTQVHENLKRLNLRATLMQGDASTPKAWWDGQHFDRILLDAPCSATGVIRRHSDIKLLRTNEDIAKVSKTQHELLYSLWPLLAQGGFLVYATCSVIPAENEQQIAHFVTEHSNCTVIKNQYPWGRSTGHGQQILPGEYGMDGFFYAVLFKSTNFTTGD